MAENTSGHKTGQGHSPQYTNRHKIPTIAKFREEKEARKAAALQPEQEDTSHHDASLVPTNPFKQEDGAGGLKDSWNRHRHQSQNAKWHKEPTASDPPSNQSPSQQQQQQQQQQHAGKDDNEKTNSITSPSAPPEDTSEAPSGSTASDVKRRRKVLLSSSDERAERQVTDPVTHLPITIHDLTSDSLRDVEENDAPFGSTSRSATGLSNKNKSAATLDKEGKELQDAHQDMRTLFPPPDFDAIKQEIAEVSKLSVTVGLVGVLALVGLAVGLGKVMSSGFALGWITTGDDRWQVYVRIVVWGLIGSSVVGGVALLIRGLRDWMQHRINRVWEEEIWDAARQSERRAAKSHETETTVWLNSLLGSVWPLINPDLFLSLADTLEDVMQASLPKMVQMVSVDDIGQGNEALRILGVKWLPSGAAARSINEDGSFKPQKDDSHANDREVPGKGSVEPQNDDEEDNKEGEDSEQRDDGSQQQVAEGMEAEEGDFINLEVAFAYRARTGRKSSRDRAKDMHIYIVFYLPGNLKIPVWVNLRGLVGSMRLRMQLCPDPPFFSLCTLTFLGQPQVDIRCAPLSKHALNIMDMPLISNFVQSAINAAMAEYVAPKSLNLDLKDMLAGDDFKRDTTARGVLVVQIKRGYDFKYGDRSILGKASSDPYVTVGWAKFGKPVWSTRMLLDEMEPVWHETAYLLVTPQELNVEERVRVQLWDSDRLSADDDLGRIEVGLKQLMHDTESNGKMSDRTDGFRALRAGENMPGKLEWSVGYFEKVRIQDCQLQKQSFDPQVRSMDQLEKKVDRICERKLQEARVMKGRHSQDAEELKQQRAQEMKTREDSMIISAPPPDGYPSGIFSIQIHQITGLVLEDLSNDYADNEMETGEGLPSAYCTLIINQAKVFKTRTKPKNSKPFYNAGTERFIADWHNTEVFLTVRDARISEDDPLLGIVHLSLGDIFKDRTQINGFYPLAGGVGFGRVRLSMVWRSVSLQAPPEALGWNFGTVEVPPTLSSADVPADLKSLKLKFYTDLGRGKLYASGGDGGKWESRRQQSLMLPVQRRYSSCLVAQFRRHGMAGEKTAAFAVFWLRDIADGQKREITLPVWKGDVERATKCSVEECGEKVGSITLGLTFWNGLGAAHSRWANKTEDMRNVVEVLETARDNLEQMENEKEVGVVNSEDISSSDEDGSDDEDEVEDAADGGEPTDGADAQKSGVVGKVKEQVRHHKSLNRRNRGIMQWKAPRTAQWAVNKLDKTGSDFAGMFKHHSEDGGIETEV